ncbi:hypothetical protein SLEP1_g20579 [Rubroshorea leprosula]|uniref:Uncharacterized protein n=1 Tax=Rubroshorea leprosula TaxID=152421 RepID=A0AAV5JC55_9ROSI|nr:hypothetical protein SLEP1_g20579 [Rubroshorea leprosula]
MNFGSIKLCFKLGLASVLANFGSAVIVHDTVHGTVHRSLFTHRWPTINRDLND